MPNGFAVTIFVITILLSPLAAQIRGTASGAGASVRAGFMGPGFVGTGVAVGPGHFRHPHSWGRSSILLPYPYYYSDYGYDSQEAAQPQVVVVPAAAPAQPALLAPPLESLLIEWQGDHFERMTLSQKGSASGQSAPDYSEKYRLGSASPGLSSFGSTAPGSFAPLSPVPGSRSRARKVAAQPRRELPPAVLVFRDGRTEEVSNYTIMSGTIYSKADYWTTGSWVRKIQIADLDVPATLKLNQEHGLIFVLPASPNEVVMRP